MLIVEIGGNFNQLDKADTILMTAIFPPTLRQEKFERIWQMIMSDYWGHEDLPFVAPGLVTIMITEGALCTSMVAQNYVYL